MVAKVNKSLIVNYTEGKQRIGYLKDRLIEYKAKVPAGQFTILDLLSVHDDISIAKIDINIKISLTGIAAVGQQQEADPTYDCTVQWGALIPLIDNLLADLVVVNNGLNQSGLTMTAIAAGYKIIPGSALSAAGASFNALLAAIE